MREIEVPNGFSATSLQQTRKKQKSFIVSKRTYANGNLRIRIVDGSDGKIP